MILSVKLRCSILSRWVVQLGVGGGSFTSHSVWNECHKTFRGGEGISLLGKLGYIDPEAASYVTKLFTS